MSESFTMFGKNTEPKRFSSARQFLAATKTVGKVLRRGRSSKTTSLIEPVPEQPPKTPEPPLLPTEILIFIFEALRASDASTEDIQNFRLSCSLFNDIAMEYIYNDMTLHLDEGINTKARITYILKNNKHCLPLITNLAIHGFPASRIRNGFFNGERIMGYNSARREASRQATKDLLEALEPMQLKSFSIAGRSIPPRIGKIHPSLLLDKQPYLCRLNMPITLLFDHGDNTSEMLNFVPRFKALVLTDLKYPRHIADLWALIKNSEFTLKSLVLKSPDNSDLERFLCFRPGFPNGKVGLPRTGASLRRLQDLHLEGFPKLEWFLSDCAPNLIDFSKLRMLRLERCFRADPFLLSTCNATRMPKLTSLQLFETGSTPVFEQVMAVTAPLETLAVRFDTWADGPHYHLIKDYHAKSLRRLWIEQKMTHNGLNVMLDMRNERPPYTYQFFPEGWPKLEEVALDIRQAAWTILPETVKVCRTVGFFAQISIRLFHPQDLVPQEQPGKESQLKVVALGTMDHPDSRKTLHEPVLHQVERDGDGKQIPSTSYILIEDVKKLVPDSHIFWYDRIDRIWCDSEGSLWQ